MNNNISINTNIPNHVGILMDGNRKWANAAGLSKKEGHASGAKNLKKICILCKKIGIKYLTTYAFSTENWKRSREEVEDLLSVILIDLLSDEPFFLNNNVNVRIIGSREGLNKDITSKLDKIQSVTSKCDSIFLTIAFNYGGREEIIEAFNNIIYEIKNGVEYTIVTEDILEEKLQSGGLPEPELIIRTSGVKRLSRFLMWKSTNAELIFVDKYWPEFTEKDIMECLSIYQLR